MELHEFHIGKTFKWADITYRCEDIGSRFVIAKNAEPPTSGKAGNGYEVFDETRQEQCTPCFDPRRASRRAKSA